MIKNAMIKSVITRREERTMTTILILEAEAIVPDPEEMAEGSDLDSVTGESVLREWVV
jgi:hypothetical protein